MALAVLYEIPRSDEDLKVWGFVNMAHHRDIIRVIYEESGEQQPEYILDPINPLVMETWLYQHQLMHDNMNAALGVAGYNLLELNWDDPANWINQHAQEHFAVGQILQLG